jgi:hypothetical protein
LNPTLHVFNGARSYRGRSRRSKDACFDGNNDFSQKNAKIIEIHGK